MTQWATMLHTICCICIVYATYYMTHIKFLTYINWFHLWVPVKRFVDTFMWFFHIQATVLHAVVLQAAYIVLDVLQCSSKKLIGYWFSITINLYSLDHIEGWRLEKLISHVKYDLTYLIKKLDLSRKFLLLTVTLGDSAGL